MQGSAEAVRQSLEKLSNDEVRVRVIHGAVSAPSAKVRCHAWPTPPTPSSSALMSARTRLPRTNAKRDRRGYAHVPRHLRLPSTKSSPTL
ncbi:MAG: hypothetical protein ACLUW8_05110 [Subdoligranulum sp.]